MHRLPSAGLAGSILLIALTLTACDHPAQVCSSPTTTDEVTSILLDHAKALSSPLLGDGMGAAIGKLFDAHSGQYDLVVFDGQDAQTKKITCSARLQLTAAIPAAPGRPASTAKLDPIDLSFTRQPSADGKTFVFSVDHADDVAQTIVRGVTSIAVALNQAQAGQGAPAGQAPQTNTVETPSSAAEPSAEQPSDDSSPSSNTDQNDEGPGAG